MHIGLAKVSYLSTVRSMFQYATDIHFTLVGAVSGRIVEVGRCCWVVALQRVYAGVYVSGLGLGFTFIYMYTVGEVRQGVHVNRSHIDMFKVRQGDRGVPDQQDSYQLGRGGGLGIRWGGSNKEGGLGNMWGGSNKKEGIHHITYHRLGIIIYQS